MRILFIATNPSIREASTRYRITAYFDALKAAGHETHLSTFFQDRLGSRVGRYAKGLARRGLALAHANRFDLVVIHRELLPLSWNAPVELVRRRVPVVFDFDDAIFLPSEEGWRSKLAFPESTRRLVDAAAMTFAGNPYLAEYAREISSRVQVLPTVVDTDVYRPSTDEPREVPLLGWIGSPSTAKYLDAILPVLDDLGRSFRFRLRVVGAGKPVRLTHVDVETPPWSAATEAQMFRELDIGLYPLADDRWARGKCGFKAIQYMASGVASVVAPIGVVRDIARPDVDAFWAESSHAWRDSIAALLSSPQRRRQMALEARRRAVAHWSLASTTPRFIAELERAAQAR